MLNHKGGITKIEAEIKAKQVYEVYNKKRKIEDAKKADEEDLGELRMLEQKLRNKGE